MGPTARGEKHSLQGHKPNSGTKCDAIFWQRGHRFSAATGHDVDEGVTVEIDEPRDQPAAIHGVGRQERGLVQADGARSPQAGRWSTRGRPWSRTGAMAVCHPTPKLRAT